MTKRIGVLATGHIPPELLPRYGTYPDMFKSLMLSADPSIEAVAIDVVGGEPVPDDVSTFDGYIITGSRHGVYEDHPWISPMEDLVRKAAEKNIPNIGICFGHQLMAQAFGGKVEKSDKGWGVGLNNYEMLEPLPAAQGDLGPVNVPAMHQDQVIEAPQNATLISGWEFCPLGGFRYPGGAISFQFHPEFASDYLGDLIEARKGAVIPTDQAEQGLESLKASNDDRFRVAKWMAHHLSNS